MKAHLRKVAGSAAVSALILSFISWMGTENHYNPSIENEFIRSLKKKISNYNEQFAEDRVYLQLDKPFYEPGENIWFNAFLRNSTDLKASSQSDILQVELIGPKGNTEKKISLIARDGKAAGDFALGPEATGGLYKIKAWTNWMKNEGENNVFEKEIQVQDVILPALKMKLDFERKAFGAGDEVLAKIELQTNENKPLAEYPVKYAASLNGEKLTEKSIVTDKDGISYARFSLPAKLKSNDGLLNVMINYQGNTESISRSIPIILNKIDLKLFPEGGDLVSGLESNIAFRALNEFGKPADIDGVVLTEKGSQVASLSSFHQGMGAFRLIPQPNEKYHVKITRPEGIQETFELPEAFHRGYVMNADASRKGEISVTVNTTETEELSLIAQVRGKVYYATAIPAKKGGNRIVFPTSSFPAGVAQITLFDSKNIARAERLVFVNKHRQLDISLKTDKEKYLPREKVKMSISVKDEKGMPAPAHFSLAVVNDQLLSFADDKSGNILSQLLLQQDLKEKVEEPAFYFNAKEEKADKALDYLLMTSGWRRFTWEKVINGETPVITHQKEKAVIGGVVMDAHTQKPVAKASIKVNNGAVYTADENGRFLLNKVDLYAPALLTCEAAGYRQSTQYAYHYTNDLYLYVYDNQYYNNYNKYPSRRNRAVFAEDMGVPGVAMELAGAAGGRVAKPEPIPLRNENKPAKQNEVKKKEDGKNANAIAAADIRMDRFMKGGADEVVINEDRMAQPVQVTYYRAREFAAPVYKANESPEVRTDFRSTIYWNPDIKTDRSGKASIEFCTSDDITSFRASLEGIGSDGTPGRYEKTFFTQLPFAMTTKIPVEVATEDRVSIPLTLKNNTTAPLGGELSITAPEGLSPVGNIATVQTIMPGKAKTIFLDYRVLAKTGIGEFTVKFKACGLSDAFTQKIKIVAKGFPVTASFSGRDMEKEYNVSLSNVVKGSVEATFTAYPNVVSDLLKGIEGILREPSGCFEQTSMSSYPNAMVLDYLKTVDNPDEGLLASASNLMNRGYKRLITFETKEKGYEWFGSNPGHEALTAYGLMQFSDMKKAGGEVDQKMIDRTAGWLMDRRDGKGGFEKNARALDNFGRASKEITDAYIVYALSEAGYNDIQKEFEASWKNALAANDPYMFGLLANTAYNLKDNKKGDKAIELLHKMQEKDGSWNGKSHSITYSTGKSLIIETTALAIMATLKSGEKNNTALTKGIEYLVSSRNGYGAFGNTQGTVLALKALSQYAKFAKRTKEDGTVLVYIDGKKVAEKKYKAGENEAIVVNGLEEYLKEGDHRIKVKFSGVKDPLPYSIAVSWNTFLPASSAECAVDLKTKLSSKTAIVGETVRLTATLSNTRREGIPSTMAIIGIPAGLSVQPWQLKELQEKKVFDYYEVLGNNIALYYRCMAPGDQKVINLDLKAEIPGEYDAPASSGYLYYTNEHKSWDAVDRISIKKGS